MTSLHKVYRQLPRVCLSDLSTGGTTAKPFRLLHVLLKKIMAESMLANLIGEPIASAVKDGVKTLADELIRNAVSADLQIPLLSSKVFNDLNAMKKEFGSGVCTLVAIANMTGADMRIVRLQDFHGHTWKYPPPPSIGPGQVGVFLHGKTKLAAKGSKCACIYTAKVPNGKDMFVRLAFDSGFNRFNHRRVHTDAQYNDNNWPELTSEDAESSVSVKTFPEKADDIKGKLEIKGTIGQSYSPICQFYVGYPSEIIAERKKLEIEHSK